MVIVITISVWALGVFFYFVAIYSPIVSLFRSVQARAQVMTQIKRKHRKQAFLWPFYIHKIPALLNEANNAIRATKKKDGR